MWEPFYGNSLLPADRVKLEEEEPHDISQLSSADILGHVNIIDFFGFYIDIIRFYLRFQKEASAAQPRRLEKLGLKFEN